MELWAGCIAGALEETTYRQLLSDAGFANVGVEVTRVYDAQDLAASECCGDSLATQSGFTELTASGGRLVSAFVRATQANQCRLRVHRCASQCLLLDGRAVDVLRGLRQGGVLRDRIRVNILRVRLPLNVVNAAGQRATGRTLTAPY